MQLFVVTAFAVPPNDILKFKLQYICPNENFYLVLQFLFFQT